MTRSARRAFKNFRNMASLGRRMLTEQNPQTLNRPFDEKTPAAGKVGGQAGRAMFLEEFRKRKLGRNRATIMQDKMGA